MFYNMTADEAYERDEAERLEREAIEILGLAGGF